MIKEIDLKKCFPEYNGGNDVTAALAHIKGEFEKRVEENVEKRLHVQYVAARYKKDIKYAWEELKEILINVNKKDFKLANKLNEQVEKEKAKELAHSNSKNKGTSVE
jgi:hypothetical protein